MDSDSSDEESDEDVGMTRHERYARIAEEIEAQARAAQQEDAAANPPAGRRAWAAVGSHSLAFAAYAATDICCLYAALAGPGWLATGLMLPMLVVKAAEAAFAHTDRELAQVRYRLHRLQRPLQVAAFQLYVLAILGGLYGYKLLCAYRSLVHCEPNRTFLSELEAMDPSRQLWAELSRWDSYDLIWTAPVLMFVVVFLGCGHPTQTGVILGLAVAIILVASVIMAAMNFDYCASHHIRKHYGIIFERRRWVRCAKSGEKSWRDTEKAHFVYRASEVTGRVLVLGLGAWVASDSPWLVASVMAMDVLAGIAGMCYISGTSCEAMTLGTSLFLVNLCYFVDEPGFALPAQVLSSGLQALRTLEFAGAAALSTHVTIQSCRGGTDVLWFIIVSGLMVFAHVLHMGLQNFTKVGQPAGDLFTAILGWDIHTVETSLTFEGGCTVDMRVCDGSQRTALHLAVAAGFSEGAKLLLERGADVYALDANSDSPLHVACRKMDVELAQVVLKGVKECSQNLQRLRHQVNRQGKKPADLLPPSAPLKLAELLQDPPAQEQKEECSGGAHLAPPLQRRVRVALPPEPTPTLSATNPRRRSTFRSSIYGNILCGEHYHIWAGPRKQSGRMELASFMVSRAAGEQIERLMEHLQTMKTGQASSFRLSYLRTLSVLGSGSFGKVLKVEDVRTGDFYAMKLQKKDRATKQAVREAGVLHSTRHPCIVGLVHIFHTTVFFGIIMEFCDSDLNKRILQEESPTCSCGLPSAVAARYTSCVALALEHLHGRSIVFRDLKPENVLVVSKDRGDLAKLADFGLARSVSVEAQERGPVTPRMTIKAGTLAFMSAEALDEVDTQEVTEANSSVAGILARDWYGLGCCLLLMLMGERGGRRVYHGSRSVLLPAPEDERPALLRRAHDEGLINDDAFALLTKLSATDVEERADSKFVRQSPFLQTAIAELESSYLPGA